MALSRKSSQSVTDSLTAKKSEWALLYNWQNTADGEEATIQLVSKREKLVRKQTCKQTQTGVLFFVSFHKKKTLGPFH